MEHVNGVRYEDDGLEYEVKQRIIQREGTYVAYPALVSEADSWKLDVWNKIIQEDIGRILNIYSAYPPTSSTKEKELYLPETLHITYEIKRNDDKYLSILYRADFYSPYAAYPTQMIYTTNIDKYDDRRLRLSDFIIDRRSLAENITSWRIAGRDYEINNYSRAVSEFIKGLGKELLEIGFEYADIIGNDNYLGIYSYLTPNKLGVSLSLPNYLGDHVEYERIL